MLTKVGDFLTQHIEGELRSCRFLIGVSGGVDSMVLLEICRLLELDCAVATVNYRLRPESDAEAELVAECAAAAGFRFHQLTSELEPSAGNRQNQARQLRMNFFHRLKREHGYDWILLGNHASDLVETMLIRLLQGRHPLLWGGFSPVRGSILRPLIDVTRKEIVEWAVTSDVTWREDSSNSEDGYLRNRVRHHLLPLMQELVEREESSRWRQNALQLQQIRETLDELMKLESARCLLQQGSYRFLLDKELFRGYTSKLRSQLILRFIQQLSGGRFTPGETLLREVLLNLGRSSGGMAIGPLLQMRHNRDTIALIPLQRELPEVPLLRNGRRQLLPGTGQVSCRPVRTDRMKFSSDTAVEYVQLPQSGNCLYRTWRPGDVYRPFGHSQPRKVVDLLRSRGVLDRTGTYLLECGGRVVWIVGQALAADFGVDNRNKVRSGTYKLMVVANETG